MRVLLVTGLMVVAVGWGPSRLAAQPTDLESEARKRIEEAFQEGDAERLLTPAAERVELSVLGMQTYFSRNQALYVLQDFFKNYAPRKFTVEDESASDNDFFVSAKYWYGQAEQPLQVYARLTRQDEQWVLQELRLDRSDR